VGLADEEQRAAAAASSAATLTSRPFGAAWRVAKPVLLAGGLTMLLLKGPISAYRGSRAMFEGIELEGMRKPAQAEVAYRRALRLEPFKARSVLGLMESLRAQGKSAEALAVFAENQSEGLGMDAVLLSGLLFEDVGQPDAARAAYRRVVSFYWPTQPNHLQAAARLLQLGRSAAPIAPP
jgi:hypothetical protein